MSFENGLDIGPRMNEYTGAAFFLPSIQQPGTFRLHKEPNLTIGRRIAACGEYHSLLPSLGVVYYTSPDAPGELVSTRFDTVQNIVAGAFKITPRKEGDSATISLTQGLFDLHFER